MTHLLLKLFVKNYTDPNSPAVHSAIGKLAGIVGIVCNCLLAAGKLILGLLVGSMAVIADGVNNLSDTASSAVTLLGFRMAQSPADKDHPYGHARYEYLSGLVVAALILLVGGKLVLSSLEKIIHPTPPSISPLTLILLIVSIAVKLWMSLFFRTLDKKIDSSPLAATAVDSRNDVIATTAVLIGCLCNYFFQINIDGYIGLAVAVFILYSGVITARDTVSPLLGQQADKELVSKMTALILSHEKVLGIHDLLVHDYGPGQCYASVHVELSAEENPLVCHDIIDDIECDVLEQFHVHLVIHYDPVVENDAEQNEMREIMQSIVLNLDPQLSMHDFRIVRGSTLPKLVFDLSVPYSMSGRHREIKVKIDCALHQMGKDYTTVIRFDGK